MVGLTLPLCDKTVPMSKKFNQNLIPFEFQTQEGKSSRATLPLTVPSAGLGDWETRPRVKHLLIGGVSLEAETSFQFSNNQVSDDEGML